MADRSAAALVDALLADEEDPAEWLAEQLAADPPLVLWVVSTAARCGDFRPRSVGDVARWFREHLLEVLRWDVDSSKEFDARGASDADQCADRVATLVEVAEVAALVAAGGGEAAAEEAFLLGLLDDARQWLPPVLGRSSKKASDCLPEWLAKDGGSGAASCVAEAVCVLADTSTAALEDFDPEACRRRAAELRRSWLEELEGPVDRLPALAARLARLAELEARFQDVLEEEKLEALAEFAAGAGHEINNPLAIIGGRAQLLLADETAPERRRELALMNAQVKRAHEMIADVRLFARPPVPEPESVDLVDLVDRLIGGLTPQAAQRATSLSRSGDAGPMVIEADPAQLNVALGALCKNSLEAIGHGGHIEIALHRLAQHAEIRVSDDGPGIPPEHRRHIFDPFYSARQAGRGLGFGLSKCWRIVTNHGGRIEVQSEPGQGAAFTITLPERWSGRG